MKKRKEQNLAIIGEGLATQYLENSGYDIVTRNYYSTYGEIDIVAKHKQDIVIVEVKTRSNRSLELAENSISSLKKKRLTLSTMQYMSEHPEFSEFSYRFDVMLIFYYARDNSYKIKHYVNAFEPKIII